MNLKEGRARLVVIAIAAALVGALVGPPIVRAATKAVTLKGSGNKAKVTNQGALRVDTEARESFGALDTTAFTLPGGVVLVAFGNGDFTLSSDFGFLTNIVIDAPDASGEVTATISDEIGILWQGTVQPGEHLNDELQDGIVWSGDLSIQVSAPGQADYFLYGQAFGSGTAGAEREAAREKVMLRR